MAVTTNDSTVHNHRPYRDDQGYEADGENRSQGRHDDGITMHNAAEEEDDDDNSTLEGSPLKNANNNRNKRSLLVAKEDILHLARKRRRVARPAMINRKRNHNVPFGVDIRVVKHRSATEFIDRQSSSSSHRVEEGDVLLAFGDGVNDDNQSRYMSQLHKAFLNAQSPPPPPTTTTMTTTANKDHPVVGQEQEPQQHQQQIGLALSQRPGIHWSSQPISAAEALNFSSRPRILIQASDPYFGVVHANAVYYTRQEEIWPEQQQQQKSSSSSSSSADRLESAIRLRFREPLSVMIHPVQGCECAHEIAFYLVELIELSGDDDNNNNKNQGNSNSNERNVITNAMYRRRHRRGVIRHPRPARVVA